MKKYLAILLAAAMLFSLAACAGGEEPAQTPSEPATPPQSSTTPAAPATPATPAAPVVERASEDSDIVVAMGGDMVTFYPINTANTMDGGIQKLMMDGLVGFDKDYQLVWMLATGFEANANATEYTIFLREGISFQDGTPWNAEAAKVNLDIMANQDLGYKKNSNYKMIDTVEVVDEYTVKVNLKYSFGAFINYLAHPSALMVSPKQIQENPDSLETGAIGTGQYSLVEWRPGESWTLKLNRDWWGYDADICGGEALVAANAGFDTITFKPVTEAATRVAMMMADEAQFSGATATYVEALKANGLTVNYSSSGLSITYLYFNNQKEIFKDERVRQAINHAIDLDTMIQVTEGGAAARVYSYITPAVSYYSAQDVLYNYDVAAAKALMEAAGYSDSNRLSLTMWTQNNTSGVQRGEFLQQQLAAIYIDVNVVPQENGVLSSEVSGYSGDPAQTGYDMYLRGFSPSTGDADQGLGRFGTSMFMPTGSNYCLYSNADYDACIKAGSETGDADARKKAYDEAQAIIWKDAPTVPLFSTLDGYVYNPKKVENVCWYPDGSVYFRDGVYVG